MSSNLYLNRLSATLTNAQLAAIKQALDALENAMPFLVNLTQEERMKLPKMGAGNKPFVEDVGVLYKAGNNFFPPFIDGNEFEKDLLLYNQLDGFSARVTGLARMIEDTQMLAGHEALVSGLRYYEVGKSGADSGAPNGQVVVDRLSPRFDGQGNFKQETPETPPAV